MTISPESSTRNRLARELSMQITNITTVLNAMVADRTLPATVHRRLATVVKNVRRVGTIIGRVQEMPLREHYTLTDSEFLARVDAVLNENIMQSDIDMAFLCDRLAMSHSTFYRRIKKATGLTANEYVRRLKLACCKRLLESGEFNVSEAAVMTGFTQLAHFRKVFKREFGVLPSEVVKK